MKRFLQDNLPGFALALIISIAAYMLGRFLPLIGGPVFGITLGIFVAALWKIPQTMTKGIKFTSKYILQLAVVLLGFEMNMASIVQAGEHSMIILAVTLSSAFLTAYWLGRALKVEQKVSILIGVGTAIFEEKKVST